MRNIVNAFAEYERALIRARTRAALAVKRGKGERTGEVPFGYRLAPDGLHLESLAAEQNIITAIRRLRGDGLSANGEQVSIRLPEAWLERAEKLSRKLKDDPAHGVSRVSRAYVLRLALLRGIEALEAEAPIGASILNGD
jgi:hypothetical protein